MNRGLNALTLDLLLARIGTPGANGGVAQRRGDTGAGQASPLGRECIAYRASGSRGKKGVARFAPDREDPGFRPRSASLTRHVQCGFRVYG